MRTNSGLKFVSIQENFKNEKNTSQTNLIICIIGQTELRIDGPTK